MGTVASQSGYEIMVVASGENPATEARRIESLIARRIDGLLVVAAHDDFAATPNFPPGLPPTVLVDRALGHPHFDTVGSDNFDAGYRGCRHLLELGHRDITLLIPSINHTHLRDRLDGYRRALADAGLSTRERIIFGGGTAEGCRSAIEQDLRRPDRPTRDLRRDVLRDDGGGEGDQCAGAGFPRRDFAARLRALGMDDGRSALYQRGQPAGRELASLRGRRSATGSGARRPILLVSSWTSASTSRVDAAAASACRTPRRLGVASTGGLWLRRRADSVPRFRRERSMTRHAPSSPEKSA